LLGEAEFPLGRGRGQRLGLGLNLVLALLLALVLLLLLLAVLVLVLAVLVPLTADIEVDGEITKDPVVVEAGHYLLHLFQFSLAVLPRKGLLHLEHKPVAIHIATIELLAIILGQLILIVGHSLLLLYPLTALN